LRFIAPSPILQLVRVLVLGGTGFIGSYVVRQLVDREHEVTVLHRSASVAKLPHGVREVRAPFARLPDHLDELRRGGPEVVLDMVPYMKKSGHGSSHFVGVAARSVVITSCDVYRAFGRLWRSEVGPPDPVPLTEESPLRTLPAPDGKGGDEFDNTEVEQAVAANPDLPATILRLPTTHGPGDRQHRLASYLRAMSDGRPAIVLSTSHALWRWSRGYVENVAAAIALAVEDDRATGRTYNVAAQSALSEAAWIGVIAESFGWKGEVVVIPDTETPIRLRQPYDFSQHLEIDTGRIRSELGYHELLGESEGLHRTVEWELSMPGAAPGRQRDYAAEDEALRARGRVRDSA
jgi:nucleoside-diphosphate-sugar epimerase